MRRLVSLEISQSNVHVRWHLAAPGHSGLTQVFKRETKEIRTSEQHLAQSNYQLSSLSGLCSTTDPSQLWSFKIRHATFLNYAKYADLLIIKAQNCETTQASLGRRISV